MRYLTVAAEYTGSALKDDFTGPIDPEELGLPASIGERLREWNEAYREVIPLGPNERGRGEVQATIEALDGAGQTLARDIQAELGEAKVRYYSEGHLAYLD